jgi:hypothetical protein
MLYTPVYIQQCLKGMYCLHLQGQRVRQIRNRCQTVWTACTRKGSDTENGCAPAGSLVSSLLVYIRSWFPAHSSFCLLLASCWSLAWLTFRPSSWWEYILQNISEPLPDYSVLHPRWEYSSLIFRLLLFHQGKKYLWDHCAVSVSML